MNPELLEALRTLVRENISDQIYDVRDRAAESGDGFEGNRWDHPRVIAFSKACEVIDRTVKDADGK